MTGNVPEIAISSAGSSARAGTPVAEPSIGRNAPVAAKLRRREEIRKQGMRNVNIRPADVERAFAHPYSPERFYRSSGRH